MVIWLELDASNLQILLCFNCYTAAYVSCCCSLPALSWKLAVKCL